MLLGALGALLTGLLTGCGGPSQAAAAAIVGDQMVSLSEVQSQVDDVLRRPAAMTSLTERGGTPADLARIRVSRQIQHLLLDQAAQRDGIVVTDQQVNAELAKPEVVQQLQEDEFVFDPALARQTVRDRLIASALTAKYLDGLAVKVDVVPAATRDEALREAQLLAAGPAQANAVLVAAGANANRDLQLRAAQIPLAATAFLFGTPAAQVAVGQLPWIPEVWFAVRVTQRSTEAQPASDPNTTPLAQLGAQTLDQIGRRLTQPLAEQLNIRVNPRYGSWDPLYLTVIPPNVEPGVVIPARLS